MERLTMTDKEMDKIREHSPSFDCPVKAEEESITQKFCDTVCDEFQDECPFSNMAKKLKSYEDAEEQAIQSEKATAELYEAVTRAMREYYRRMEEVDKYYIQKLQEPITLSQRLKKWWNNNA